MERFKEYDEVLTVKDIGEILRIGRSQAYEVARRKDFPKLPIKPIRVPKKEFLKWAGFEINEER